MKTITLTQPFATLVAIGAKTIETRSWPTRYRGPLAIHAAAGLGPVGGKAGFTALCAEEPFRSVLRAYLLQLWQAAPSVRDFAEHALPRGVIVATCQLRACHRTEELMVPISEQERAFGDYTPGRWAWVLSDGRALPEPIPARGALGLWDWTQP
jgi:activating signal cointegrator 1